MSFNERSELNNVQYVSPERSFLSLSGSEDSGVVSSSLSFASFLSLLLWRGGRGRVSFSLFYGTVRVE